jgi:hypothetical protein
MFEQLKAFLIPYFKQIGLPENWLLELDFWVPLCTVLLTGIVLPSLFYVTKLIKWGLLRQKQRLLERDLHPWYTAAEIDWATRFYIPTHYQNVSPSQDDEPGRRFIASARNPLIPLFLKKVFGKTDNDNKYYLILADSGMGKSTFMINLYLAYKRQWHIFRAKFNIKLLPLGHPHALEELDKMDDKEKENTILLLDAFDEDIQALHDYQKRIEEILQKSWRFRSVIITCRTQFFPSREEEPFETGHYKFGGAGGDFKFQKLYLSVFDNKDVWCYLRKRHNIFNPFKWRQLHRAWRITQKSPNLVVRPMLLSHIEDLVKENREYEFAYQIYEVLIKKWIERESKKPGIREKYGSVEAFQEKLDRFSHHLALDMYNNREKRGGLFIPKDQVLFSDTGVALDDLFEEPDVVIKNSEWRTRSLLNRNAEGEYKFAHKSILEYFLAKELFCNMKFAEMFIFEGMDAVKRFCQEMIVEKLRYADGEFKLSKSTTIYPLSKLTQRNLEQVSSLTLKTTVLIDFMYLIIFFIKNINSISVFDKKKMKSYYNLVELLLFKEINSFKIQNQNDARYLYETFYPEKDLSDFTDFNQKYAFYRDEKKRLIHQMQWLCLVKRIQQIDGMIKEDIEEMLQRIEINHKTKDVIIEDPLLTPVIRKARSLFNEISLIDPVVIVELKSADAFINKCQSLQIDFPKIKFYY